MVGYERATNNLPEETQRGILNFWKQKDATGGLPGLKSKHRFRTENYKQVIKHHTWLKEIPYTTESRGTAILKIELKKILDKLQYNSNWHECVDVDCRLITDEGNYNAEILTRHMMEIKKWINMMIQ